MLTTSAEVRWFWRASSILEFKDWFCGIGPHGFAAGGGPPFRKDEYLIDAGQRELGIKIRGRGKGVEIKALVEQGIDSLSIPPFAGPIEIWTKANSSVITLTGCPLNLVEKLRRLRKFDTTSGTPVEIELVQDYKELPADGRRDLPLEGCNVEFTEIIINSGSDRWWSLGFEAFGLLSNIKASLVATATALAERNPPILRDGICANYPMWLADCVHVEK